MLARVLLLGLLALVGLSFPAWATGPANYPPGGSGSGVVANTCTSGDFFSAVDGSGNFTCATPAGSGDVTAVGDCASGACFDGTSGTTLTGLADTTFLLESQRSVYVNVDTDNNSTSHGFFVGLNGTGTATTRLFIVQEAGQVELRNGTDLRLYETDDSNYVQVATPSLSANWTMTLPADDGNSGQFLQTDGSGTTTWATPSGSGNVSNTGTPADNQVAVWTDATTIEGTSGLTFSAGTLTATTFSGALSGNATTATTAGAGDSATAFFSSGTIEAARLPDADDDATTKGIITLPNAQFDCTAGSCSIATGGIGSTELADTFSATTITSNLVGNVTGNADTATLAATATTANAGDSATSFFSSGELERTLLPAASADCSANQFAKGVDADFVLDCAQPDHGGLAGLSDDDHTQYLALAGRTLSDPGSGITTIATQGTSSPLTITNGTGFQWFAWEADLEVADVTTTQVFRVGGSLDRTGTTGSLIYQFTGFHVQPELTSSSAGGPLFQDAFYDASVVFQESGTATQNTYQPISFLSKPTYKAASGASLTIGQTTGVDINPSWGVAAGGTLTNTTFSAFKLHTPNEIGGTLSLPTYIALDVEDLDTAAVTTPLSLRSVGTTTEMRHAGPARFGATGAVTSGKVLDARGAATITGTLDLGDAVADPGAASTTSILEISDTIDLPNSTGNLVGIKVAPTSAQSESNNMIGIDFSPVITQSGAVKIPGVYGLNIDGTSTVTGATTFSSNALLRHNRTYTTATVDADPASNVIALSNTPGLSVSSASGTSVTSQLGAVLHAPVVTNSGGATYTVAVDYGLRMQGTYTESSGTMVVTDRVGLDFDDVTNTSSATAITNNIGVDIAALSTATTNIGIRNADTTVYTPCVDDISSNTDYMVAKSACTAINLTAGGTRNFTGGTDQIADGYDGQIIYLFFTGSNSITFDDADNLNLGAATRALSSGDTLTLLFSSTLGLWIEVAFTNN